MNLEIFDLQGASQGTLAVSDAVFGVKPKTEVVHSALNWFLASERRGTHSTLKRGEVSGGGKKPWKQKGTGRARAGTIRSPLWRHGGVIFGPKPRDYSFALPRKIRKLAVAMLLSDRAAEGRVKIIAEIKLAAPQTKEMLKVLKSLGFAGQKTLLILHEKEESLVRAGRNLENLKIVKDNEANVYDLVNAAQIILTRQAAQNLEGILK